MWDENEISIPRTRTRTVKCGLTLVFLLVIKNLSPNPFKWYTYECNKVWRICQLKFSPIATSEAPRNEFKVKQTWKDRGRELIMSRLFVSLSTGENLIKWIRDQDKMQSLRWRSWVSNAVLLVSSWRCFLCVKIQDLSWSFADRLGRQFTPHKVFSYKPYACVFLKQNTNTKLSDNIHWETDSS